MKQLTAVQSLPQRPLAIHKAWKRDVAETKYAKKCPIKNGTIIYAYRNLYNALSNEINYFEDDCDNAAQARGVKKPIEMIRLKQPKVKQNVIVDNKLLIYPNPTSNYFILKSKAMASISIFNTLGQEISNIKVLNNEHRVNTESLPNGVYIVKATDTKGKITTSKLIIQH
jgi:hypothetical protein